MYKIVGSDNIEYGPVSAEKIREWVLQGRVGAQTKIQPDTGAGWKPLAEYKEFADLFSQPAGVPPVLPPTSPIHSGKISAFAIASVVLGALGLITFGVTALLGLVLGLIALVRINNSRGALTGRGLALAGTIVSGVFVLMLPIFAAMLLPALARAKGRAQSINCMNNMKQLGLGSMMYANENKDQFPQGSHWCDALAKYVPNPRVFQCPAGDPSQRCHYAFNSHLSGVEIRNVTSPAETVLLFEVEGGWNLNGGPESVIQKPRHSRAVGIIFADGHCEVSGASRLQRVRWDP